MARINSVTRRCFGGAQLAMARPPRAGGSAAAQARAVHVADTCCVGVEFVIYKYILRILNI